MDSSIHLVDPELRGLIELLPKLDLADETLHEVRRRVDALVPPMTDVSWHNVQMRQHIVQSNTPVTITVYRPNVIGPMPVLLHIHGGGFVTGSAALMVQSNVRIASQIGCAVVSVDYRLSPETVAPGPLEDCYCALNWVYKNAPSLNFDLNKVAVGGESAGAGLAASLCMLARDRAGPAICFQWLIAPMLDDRTVDAKETGSFNGEFVWTRAANAFAWRAYLGCTPGIDGISFYASPSRATDFTRLPPAYICVGALDLFLHENIAYAKCLVDAGISTELQVHPATFHGFEVFLDTHVGRRAEQYRLDALRRAFAPDAS